jgi:hypothetical protein
MEPIRECANCGYDCRWIEEAEAWHCAECYTPWEPADGEQWAPPAEWEL